MLIYLLFVCLSTYIIVVIHCYNFVHLINRQSRYRACVQGVMFRLGDEFRDFNELEVKLHDFEQTNSVKEAGVHE